MTKQQQAVGKHGQNIAASVLSGIGFEMVEKIGTPVLLIPSRYKGLFKVVFEEAVSGDHRAIIRGGRSVLAETKTILDRNLRYSGLRDHQPGRLTSHSDLGGLSLLVWVHSSGTYIMQWPIDEFGFGKSISVEKAQELSITDIMDFD